MGLFTGMYLATFLMAKKVFLAKVLEKNQTGTLRPYFLERFSVLEIIKQNSYDVNTFEFYNSTFYSDYLNSVAIKK